MITSICLIPKGVLEHVHILYILEKFCLKNLLMWIGVHFNQILFIFKYIKFMIELHTNCYLGGGCERFLYNNNTTARFAKFGCMLPQENFEKNSVIWCILFISGSDHNFFSHNF